MLQEQFQRAIDNILAQASDRGLLIVCGWTVPVPRAQAVDYVKTYNTSASTGFFEHGGQVVFTHNYAKVTFSAAEAAAIVDLIKAAYPEAR